MRNSGLAFDGPPYCSLLLRSLVLSLRHPHGVSSVVPGSGSVPGLAPLHPLP